MFGEQKFKIVLVLYIVVIGKGSNRSALIEPIRNVGGHYFERLCLQFIMIKLVTKLNFFDKELVYLIASIHTKNNIVYAREQLLLFCLFFVLQTLKGTLN